jgi:hypothetical protein
LTRYPSFGRTCPCIAQKSPYFGYSLTDNYQPDDSITLIRWHLIHLDCHPLDPRTSNISARALLQADLFIKGSPSPSPSRIRTGSCRPACLPCLAFPLPSLLLDRLPSHSQFSQSSHTCACPPASVQAFRGRLRIHQPRRRINLLLLTAPAKQGNLKHSPCATPTRLEYSEFEKLPAGRKVYYLRLIFPPSRSTSNNSTIPRPSFRGLSCLVLSSSCYQPNSLWAPHRSDFLHFLAAFPQPRLRRQY